MGAGHDVYARPREAKPLLCSAHCAFGLMRFRGSLMSSPLYACSPPSAGCSSAGGHLRNRRATACRQVTPQDVDCKPIEADDLGKTVDDAGNIVECVSEFFSRRHVGLTEPRKVRRDDMKSVGKVLDLGCMMSINPDAHSTRELDL